MYCVTYNDMALGNNNINKYIISSQYFTFFKSRMSSGSVPPTAFSKIDVKIPNTLMSDYESWDIRTRKQNDILQ